MDERSYQQGWNDALVALDGLLFDDSLTFTPCARNFTHLDIRGKINELKD